MLLYVIILLFIITIYNNFSLTASMCHRYKKIHVHIMHNVTLPHLLRPLQNVYLYHLKYGMALCYNRVYII